MVFQYAKRYRWLLWLSGALVLSSLTSTKAASSFRHALGVASEDQLNRQLSVKDPPVLDFNSINEERAPSLDASALYDKLVGTSMMNYKKWVKKLGFSLKQEGELNDKAYNTIFPILLDKHSVLQLRHLFHDSEVDFRGVTYHGETLGLRLLQQWAKEGQPDNEIMQRMLQVDSNGRNMLNDDSMLRTWISFSNGRELDPDSYDWMLSAIDESTISKKDALQFFFAVSEMSENPNIKTAAVNHAIGMFETYYAKGWSRESIVENLHITGDEVMKMETVLRRYDVFAASRSADKEVIKKIVRVETKNKKKADRLENSLFEKWSDEGWFPITGMWELEEEESIVLNRLINRMALDQFGL